MDRESRLPLPYGVRIFAWVRAIRWIGWGLGEPLLPVFILAFSQTFAEMGLLSSTVEIVSLISLPVIGFWADRMPAKRLVLWSLILYPLVGISYLFAGIFNAAVFVVLALAINGFTWELENVGIETYYRRVIQRSKIATSFGFLDTLSSLSWILAALAGMFLVTLMPIYMLLFGIAPFSIVAYLIAHKGPNDMVIDTESKRTVAISLGLKTFRGWRAWIGKYWLLAMLVFFSSIINSLIYFFIPITAYRAGANLPMVVLITVLGAMPALFAYKLGVVADKHNRYSLSSFGLICVGIITVALAAIHSYWFNLGSVFLMGIILELFYVVQSSLITTLGSAGTYGIRGSTFESISILGELTAPLLLGVSLDVIGFSKVSFGVGLVAFILALVFRFKKADT